MVKFYFITHLRSTVAENISHIHDMAVGGTLVGPVLAGPILARASYIKVFISVKLILLRRKILSKSNCNYILYYSVW